MAAPKGNCTVGTSCAEFAGESANSIIRRMHDALASIPECPFARIMREQGRPHTDGYVLLISMRDWDDAGSPALPRYVKPSKTVLPGGACAMLDICLANGSPNARFY